MALLMLRTHDLSWQDHVVNIEYMVNPTHNQLLFTKHKTLASKCDKVKRLYESEQKTAQKNTIVDIRMMERKKMALQRRKLEIMSAKTNTEFSMRRLTKPRSENNNISKADITRGKSAPPNIHSTFITEVDHYGMGADDRSSEFYSASSPKTIQTWNTTNPTSSRPSTEQLRFHSPTKSSPRRKYNVRFDENIDKVDHTTAETSGMDESNLGGKIKEFLKKQHDFNNRPLAYVGRFKLTMDNSTRYRSPLVAKRYSNTKLDKEVLVNAFDKLCHDRSLDNFKKLSALANRVKTNYKLARNTSLIPTVGTLKAKNRFKGLTSA